MRTVFADTFYFLALINRRDQYATRVAEFNKTFHGGIVTTESLLIELADGLAASHIRSQVRDYILHLRNQRSCDIIPISHDLFDRALYQRNDDKDWSLTDCISFVVMREMSITDALTGDHHFKQAGFEALFL